MGLGKSLSQNGCHNVSWSAENVQGNIKDIEKTLKKTLKKGKKAKIRRQYPRVQHPLYPTRCRVFSPNFINTGSVQTFGPAPVGSTSKKKLINSKRVLQNVCNTHSFFFLYFKVLVIQNKVQSGL